MTKNKSRKLSYDCKYYIGDRPCRWHKQTGILCECEDYTPLKGNLLIIKLDAIGDVLRTTCILPVIVKEWPNLRISWITRPEAISLLENNPYIDEIVAYGPDALLHLLSKKFDYVINLDAGKISSEIATIAKAREKVGFVMHENGYVIATNKEAEEWLQLGVFDDLKKANKRSYQEIMCSIAGIPSEDMAYVLSLKEEEKEKGRSCLQEIGVDIKKPIVGIHTGGGGRWRLKQWAEENIIALID
ncbi:MAG: hypothetical protein LWX54_16915, partial [Deltaproteobacteria bacterium]|nr:hypothetical protein [Deltaproteobacteria bacterium]